MMSFTEFPIPTVAVNLANLNSAADKAIRGGGGFATVAALLADTSAARGEGAIWEAGGFRYQEAASSATDHHVTTAGGVKLYVLPGAEGRVNVLSVGARGDGATDDTSAIQVAIDLNLPLKFPKAVYKVTGALSFASSAGTPKVLNWEGDNGATIAFSGGGSATFTKSDQPPCGIKNIIFTSDGNAATFVTMRAASAKIEGCSFLDFDTALKVSQAYQIITGNLFKSCNLGITNIDSASDYYNSNTITSNVFANGVIGMKFSDNTNTPDLTNFFSNNLYINFNTFENNTGKAIELENFHNVTIHQNWIEAAVAPINCILATDCQNLNISALWSQYTAAYAVSLVRSTAIVGNIRGTKFTLADNSTLYLAGPTVGQNITIARSGGSVVRQLGGVSPTYTAARAGVDLTPMIQNHDTAQDVAAMVVRWSYDGVPPGYIAGSSRGASVGDYVALTSGDTLGAMMFAGASGTRLMIPAQVSAAAMGTFSDSSTPTSLQFWTTPSGAVNPIRRLEIQPNGDLFPYADNLYSLGGASNRWTVVHAATGTINTSDANEKQQVEELSDLERQVAVTLKSLVRRFKFNDAVQTKGEDARYHIGVIAQDVEAAFSAAGLSAADYGILCKDTWTDADGNEQSRMGVRYEELFAFILAAL
jgi:hypothetical protein